MSEPSIRTRRQFLKSGLVGGALTWTVPGFLHTTMQELHAASIDSLVQAPTGKDGPILVVIQLAGGNDGLNTVVPYASDDYRRARPVLGIPESDCLRIDDTLAMHPGLTGLKSLYDDGLLAVIEGVGYPNPNRSHFRSMEIWQTASDSERFESHGWIGRYFDSQCQGADAGVGVAIGAESPQAFASAHPKGIAFTNPYQFRFVGLEDAEEVELFNEMNAVEDDNAGASIQELGGAKHVPGAGSPLDFLERTAMDAQVSSDSIRRIIRSSQNRADYRNSGISNDLKTVARLIAGALPTRIYYVSQGGYDTHTNQLGTHERLLREFSDALSAFLKDLKAQGNLDRVQVLTFSEFGRRVKENASGGTDHGAAAPVFVAGGRTRGGLYGTPPVLAEDALYRGDVTHGVDFRSVYATLLERHLGAPSEAILGRAFPLLDVV